MTKILVIDDDADVLHLVQIKLKQAGFEVYTAEDGATGWEIFQSEQSEIVICEIQLPGLDGLTLTGKLKTEPESSPMVILLTDLKTDTDIAAGFEAGADDYVFKPFSPQVLVERIQVALVRAGVSTSNSEVEAANG